MPNQEVGFLEFSSTFRESWLDSKFHRKLQHMVAFKKYLKNILLDIVI